MSAYYDHDLPDAAHAFIGAHLGQLAVIAFAPGGGWVGVAANGAYEAHGIPQECFDTLVAYLKNGWTVRSIAFPPAGGDSWVIVADQNYFARNIPDECYQMIGTFFKNGWPIRCVAFPPSGGNSWAIVGTNAYYARNIDDECFQLLSNYLQGDRRATGVAFAPGGGWVVFGGGAFFARNIDPGAYQQMLAITGAGSLIDHVAFVPGGDGWSVAADGPLPAGSDPIRTFETQFYQDASGTWHSIWERMAAHGVPGTSVALVHGGAVAWRTSYGVLEAGTENYVYADTPFQAASISKPHTAVGILRLIQEGTGNVALDDTVQAHTTWTVPTRACSGASGWVAQATIARTLAHQGGFVGRGNTYPLGACSGFTADGGGFGGYPDTGGPLPTLDQILAGTSPANSPKIELSSAPGTSYYSGMGYVALLRMLQDVTGSAFADWMQAHVLTPLGMSGSTFALTLPAALARAASGHSSATAVIPGKRNRYPESSAAGLYTNAGDLGRFIVMLNAGGTIGGTQVLTQQSRDRMLTDQLGIFRSGNLTDQNCFYNHNGSNAGFSALIQGYPNLGAGFAIMTNVDDGAGGSAFYGEAGAALRRVYGLP